MKILPSVVSQGRPLLIAFVFLATLSFVVSVFWLASFFLVAAACLFYIFRDPERKIPPLPLAVVCPVDSEVVQIQEAQDPYLERRSIRVDLRMGFFDSYTIRSPVEGQYKKHWTENPGATRANGSSYAFWIQTDEEDDVVVVVNRVSRWRYLCINANAGERTGQGKRFGSIRFGSEVSLYLPHDARIKICSGDRVLAGSDVIGEIVRSSATPRATGLQ